MIETRLMTYFLAVAREQNITKAAESLHITQPTLSQQMMTLEKQLGKQLFIRGKKSMTLTAEGAFFRQQAEEILDLLEHAERSIRSGETLDSGVIRIGCSETSLPDFVSAAFRKLQQARPGVQLHVEMENCDSMTRLLDKNALDMALLFSAFRIPGYNHYAMPLHSRWGLLLPAYSLLARKPNVTARDMKTLPLIFPYKVFHTPQQPNYFPFDPQELNIPVVCNHFEEAIRLTQQGLGHAYILEHAFVPDRYPDLVFRPLEPAIVTPFYLLTKKEAALPPAPHEFLDLLLEELNRQAV